MKQIPLSLFIEKNITSDESFEIKTQGTVIYYQKKYYIITLHNGLPITTIKDQLNNITFTKDDFKLVKWNDLAYIDITLISDKYVTSNLFVFKQFVKKQINVTSNYYFADSSDDYSGWNNIVKYEINDFFPINMIPGNPSNMYYKMKLTKTNTVILKYILSGSSIYDSKNRLIGIIYMQEDQYIYIIPTTYIIRTLEKNDNDTIYTFPTQDDIVKIGNNKVTKNKNSIQSIYSHKINTRVPLDCYFAFEGDIDIFCILTLNNLVDEFNKLKISKPIKNLQYNIRKYNYSEFTNLLIPNSFNISICENKIKINSSLFHLMRTCYKDIEIIKKIFSTIIPGEKKIFNHSINNTIYSFENY
jgi:hypothetical protein